MSLKLERFMKERSELKGATRNNLLSLLLVPYTDIMHNKNNDVGFIKDYLTSRYGFSRDSLLFFNELLGQLKDSKGIEGKFIVFLYRSNKKAHHHISAVSNSIVSPNGNEVPWPLVFLAEHVYLAEENEFIDFRCRDSNHRFSFDELVPTQSIVSKP